MLRDKRIERWIAGIAVGVMALTLAQCKKSPTAPEKKVAAQNLVTNVSSTVVPALEATPFTFPNGGGALSPALNGQTFTLTFSNTSAATPTATVTVAGGGGFTATTTFGSCIFRITTSTNPQIVVGSTITVNPCQVNVQTGGIVATGQATTVQILLQLGVVPSAANQAAVSINPTTGVVTVNGVPNVGTVTLTLTGS